MTPDNFRPEDRSLINSDRSSKELKPPDAITRKVVLDKTSDKPFMSGPSRVPSTLISVTIAVSTPLLSN